MSETPAPVDTPASTPAPEAGPVADGVNLFSRDYVEELRRENAAHRTGKKDAVETAKAELTREFEAKLAEKDTAYTELQNELGKAWIELEKVYTTLDAKVPSEKVRSFVEILSGEDKDSITESVKSRLELVGGFKSTTPAFDPSQGLGGKGSEVPLNGDKLMNALTAKLGIQPKSK
jgi:hypothetical protein